MINTDEVKVYEAVRNESEDPCAPKWKRGTLLSGGGSAIGATDGVQKLNDWIKNSSTQVIQSPPCGKGCICHYTSIERTGWREVGICDWHFRSNAGGGERRDLLLVTDKRIEREIVVERGICAPERAGCETMGDC